MINLAPPSSPFVTQESPYANRQSFLQSLNQDLRHLFVYLEIHQDEKRVKIFLTYCLRHAHTIILYAYLNIFFA
jgi:hypothetical protein